MQMLEIVLQLIRLVCMKMIFDNKIINQFFTSAMQFHCSNILTILFYMLCDELFDLNC